MHHLTKTETNKKILVTGSSHIDFSKKVALDLKVPLLKKSDIYSRKLTSSLRNLVEIDLNMLLTFSDSSFNAIRSVGFSVKILNNLYHETNSFSDVISTCLF